MTKKDDLYVFPIRRQPPVVAEDEDDDAWHEDYISLNQYFDEEKRPRRLRKRPRELMNTDNGLPGLQYIDMFVGNPAQRLTFVISTSSDHTIFPCTSDCPGHVCNGAKQVQFEKSYSSTFERMDCDECMTALNQLQSDWSCKNDLCTVEGNLLSSTSRTESYTMENNNIWTAYHGRDFIHAGETSNGNPKPIVGTDRTVKEGFQFVFACQLSATGETIEPILKNANGILGLSTSKTSFVNQMFEAGKLQGSFFSICFHPNHAYSSNSKSAGILVLGGYNAEYHTTDMIYMKNTREGNKQYTLKINNIYLRQGGGESVTPINPNQRIVKLDYDQIDMAYSYAFLDNTSPYTHLYQVVNEPFKNEWKLMTGIEYTYTTMAITEEEMRDLPTVLIQFQTSYSKNQYVNPDDTPGMVGFMDRENPFDALLAIPPQHYMEAVPGGYRIRMSVNRPNYSVIGSNALQARHLNFDLISPRIGIAETTLCEEPRTPYPTFPPTFPPPTKTPSRYADTIAYQQERLPSSAPSMQPTDKSERTFQSSRGDLALMFSKNSFSYEQFYFIGMGVLGAAFVLLIFLSFYVSGRQKNNSDGDETKDWISDKRALLDRKKRMSFRNMSYGRIKRMPSYLSRNRHRPSPNEGQVRRIPIIEE